MSSPYQNPNPQQPPQYQQPSQYQQPPYQQTPPAPQPNIRYQPQYPAANPADTGSFGWAVLGFFVPLVGLILYLVWKNEKPLSAKKAGMGALVSVIVAIVFYALVFIIMLIAASAASSY